MHVRIKNEPPDVSESGSDTMSDWLFRDNPIKKAKSRDHHVSESDSDSGDFEHQIRPKKSPKSKVIYKSEPADDSEDERPQPAARSPKKSKHKRSLEVLDGMVSCPLDFATIRTPGLLSTMDLMDNDNEFYLFRFPSGLINPEDLVGSKLRVGGKKSNAFTIKNKSFDIATYESSSIADTPTLFLPDTKGQLRQVDLNISGHIVIKENPISQEQPQFNIDDFRLQPHVLPEIKPRSFFTCSGTVVSKKSKLSKEERKLGKRKRSLEESELTPLKKKKKSRSSLE